MWLPNIHILDPAWQNQEGVKDLGIKIIFKYCNVICKLFTKYYTINIKIWKIYQLMSAVFFLQTKPNLNTKIISWCEQFCHRHHLQCSPGSFKITSYGELTTPATRAYPDWSLVCCEETVDQSKTSN